MGIAKIAGIVIVLYLLIGFVFAYLLAIGMISIYGNVITEFIALIFSPVLYGYDFTAPIIGLPPTETSFFFAG